ncbi:MAG: hypothetical protein WC144_02185 [Sulfurimonas sp.]
MFLKLITIGSALAIFFSGCVTKTPSPNAKIDDSLPVVQMTQNSTVVDHSSIALEWKLIEDPRVDGIYVYRVDMQKQNTTDKSSYYDTITSRFATHYVDRKIKSDKQYGYYFKTYSDELISKSSEMVTVNSLPQMESVSWIHATGGMPRTVKVLWRPHSSEKVKSYIVERRTLEDAKYKKIATVNGRLNVEYIDSELKDKFTYIYRVKALTYDGLESLPSQEVSVSTKPLPLPVEQIRATTDMPRAIRVEWDYMPNEDFNIYRVYRSTSVNSGFEAITDTKNNYYIDSLKNDGKEYFYRVGVFDRDGLESNNSNYTAMGKTLIKPNTPSITGAKIVDGRVHITWISVDPRVKSFIVEKKHKKNLFDNKVTQIKGITSNEIYDSYIQNGETYIYKVYAIDANSIVSEPSIEVAIKVKDEAINAQPIKEQIPDNIVQTPSSPTIEPQKKVSQELEEIIMPLDDF